MSDFESIEEELKFMADCADNHDDSEQSQMFIRYLAEFRKYQSELSALREELAAMTQSRDYCNRVALHNKELSGHLQQYLTAAEQRSAGHKFHADEFLAELNKANEEIVRISSLIPEAYEPEGAVFECARSYISDLEKAVLILQSRLDASELNRKKLQSRFDRHIFISSEKQKNKNMRISSLEAVLRITKSWMDRAADIANHSNIDDVVSICRSNEKLIADALKPTESGAGE